MFWDVADESGMQMPSEFVVRMNGTWLLKKMCRRLVDTRVIDTTCIIASYLVAAFHKHQYDSYIIYMYSSSFQDELLGVPGNLQMI